MRLAYAYEPFNSFLSILLRPPQRKGDGVFDGYIDCNRIANSQRSLVSLWDMQIFYVDRFCKSLGLLAQCWVLINRDHGLKPNAWTTLAGNISVLEDLLNDLDLRTSLVQAKRISDKLKTGDFNLEFFAKDLTDLYGRVIDELSAQLVLFVPFKDRGLYENVTHFGEEVYNRFPSAIIDIEEAGKCIALGRYTAAVFHCMRVVEAGLRGLSKTLNEPGLDPKTNPTWERILRRCDDELKLPLQKRTPEWRTDEVFFSQATANLRAVKDAWRNPTLHVELSYSEDRSRDVFNAVRAFMRHLAEKIGEP